MSGEGRTEERVKERMKGKNEVIEKKTPFAMLSCQVGVFIVVLSGSK